MKDKKIDEEVEEKIRERIEAKAGNGGFKNGSLEISWLENANKGERSA